MIKKWLCLLLLTTLLFVAAACDNPAEKTLLPETEDTPPPDAEIPPFDEPIEESMPNPPEAGSEPFPEDSATPSQPTPSLTQDEAQTKAASYYADDLWLVYDEIAYITGYIAGADKASAWCYLFTVYDGGRRVSRAAVELEDATLWFADMYTVDTDEPYWMREDFMGYPKDEGSSQVSTTYLDFSQGENAQGKYRAGYYIAMLNTIPEFTDRNEGSATWYPDEHRLDLGMRVGLGSVTGALDGPKLNLTVVWQDELPQIITKEFKPAPIFSHPDEVKNSGAELYIEDTRLLEIAAYFRELITANPDYAPV